MSLYKKYIFPFFDQFEDKTRSWLSRRPKLYAFLAGAAIVMLWRAIWHTADILEAYGGVVGFLFTPPVTLVTSTLVLLGSGLFVSFFVGDAIIMSGLRKEKKFVDHAQEEMDKEEKELHHMERLLDRMETEVEHLHGAHSHDHGTPAKQIETMTEHRSGGGVQPKG
jgi:hypothetical protein